MNSIYKTANTIKDVDISGVTGGGKPRGGGGKPAGPSKADEYVASVQKKYPQAVAAIKKMQQAMQALAYTLYNKYNSSKDPTAAAKKSEALKFDVTQAGTKVQTSEDGVWGQNTKISLDNIQKYIDKYFPNQISTKIENFAAGVNAPYEQSPMITGYVDNNIRVIMELADKEDQTMAGYTPDVSAREFDRIPQSFNAAKQDLIVDNRKDGIPIGAANLQGLYTVYLVLKNMDMGGVVRTLMPTEYQIFLREAGAMTPSVKNATIEDFQNYLEENHVYTDARSLWNGLKNYTTADFVPSLVQSKDLYVNAFMNAYNVLAAQGFVEKGIENVINKVLSSVDKLIPKSALENNTLDNMIASLNKYLKEDVFKTVLENIKRNGSPEVLRSFTQMAGQDFRRGAPRSEDLQNLADLAYRNVAQAVNVFCDKLKTALANNVVGQEQLNSAFNNVKNNPQYAGAGFSAYLGKVQASKQAEADANTYWTMGQMQQIVQMIVNRADAQAEAAGVSAKAAEINDLIKTSQTSAGAVSTMTPEAAKNFLGSVGRGISRWFGGDEPAGQQYAASSTTNKAVKEKYKEMANALLAQINAFRATIKAQLSSRGLGVSEETIGGVILPPEANFQTVLSEMSPRDRAAAVFGEGAGREYGGEGGGGGFGGEGYGRNRQAETTPAEPPFRKWGAYIPGLMAWANVSSEPTNYDEELLYKKPSIKLSELVYGGTAASELSTRIGNPMRYINELRKLANAAYNGFMRDVRKHPEKWDEDEVSNQSTYAGALFEHFNIFEQNLNRRQ